MAKCGTESTVDPDKEIGENITITDRSQLLSITLDQAKNLKFIRIKNLEID